MNKIDQFNEHRSLLFAIAYRMLGSAMEAEDIVQETFIRWQQVPEATVKSTKAYLTSITTRLCIDQLRSARVKREQYLGPWLPEPMLTESPSGPDDPDGLAESLSIAFLVLLESLSPTERAVFLLREVFDYDYAEIASIVGKSEVNCRQVARRARQHVTARRPRFNPSPTEQERLTTQFMETIVNGDMPGLVNLLAEDITLWSDGGGKVVSAIRPIYGAANVAKFLIGLGGKMPANFEVRFAWINNQLGIVGYEDELPTTVLTFESAEGRIQAIRVVRNPDKLRVIPPNVETDQMRPGDRNFPDDGRCSSRKV